MVFTEQNESKQIIERATMKLTIQSLINKGDETKERPVIDAAEHCWLDDYIVFDNTYPNDRLSNGDKSWN